MSAARPFGAPLPRLDGAVKVTGAARYAADHRVEGMLHGVLVGAPLPTGRLRAIETSEALAVPGVTAVLTHADFPRLGTPPFPVASARIPLQDDEIRYQDEPIAVVLAETLEDAQHAATLVRADVEPAPFTPHPLPTRDGAVLPDPTSPWLFFPVDVDHGDADDELAAAAVRHEATYIQHSRHHNPIEPSATIAAWREGNLELIDAVQHGYGVRAVMAAVFDLAPERIRVLARHTGGGFGSKGSVYPHQIVTAAAARIAGRPVRIVLSRAQMYSIVTFQPQMVQTIALGADGDGRLRAVEHEVMNVTSITDDYVEFGTEASQSGYAARAIRLRQRVQRAHINVPNPMRAPADGCGIWALGSAMNELADRLGTDPVALRLANYAEAHPVTGQQWSSKKLRECYEDGARAFGWRGRPSEPERDGPWLIGQGMSDCAHGVAHLPSTAQIRLMADATAVIEAGFQDIGTGTLTIFPQIAADVLGLEPGLVTCRMGDTNLPETGPSYASSATMSIGGAVMQAAEDLLAKLGDLAGSPLGPAPGPGALVASMRTAGLDELVGEGAFGRASLGEAISDDAFAGSRGTPYALHTFGAVFVEVGVDPELGLVRLRRAVGRYSVGRIVNPRTAGSQIIGGIVWGWGKATMEVSQHDRNLGRWLSKNLSGVALPVNADIPSAIDVGFIDEFDEHCGPIGGKGVGELGATGVDAAVADAVFHATGRRIRELPITPDKLVG